MSGGAVSDMSRVTHAESNRGPCNQEKKGFARLRADSFFFFFMVHRMISYRMHTISKYLLYVSHIIDGIRHSCLPLFVCLVMTPPLPLLFLLPSFPPLALALAGA